MVGKKYVRIGIIIAVGIVLSLGIYKWYFGQPQKRNALIVGTCSGFPPYELLNEQGTIVGFDIDVAQAIATAMEKDLEVQDMSFDSLIVALQQGKIDCAISGISITKSRQQEIELIHYIGKPLTALPLVFWKEIPAGVQTVEDVVKLENKTVCAQAGTIHQEIIAGYKGIEVKCLENIPDLIMDIKYGKSVAAVLEPKVVTALQAEYPELKTLSIPLDQAKQDFGSGIGINKNNKKLINLISTIVANLKSSGTMEMLESKWFKGGSHGAQ